MTPSRLIDIADDLAVRTSDVVAVRNLGGGKCAVFLAGQSAVDGGFTVEREFEELVAELNDETDDGEDAEGEDGDETEED